MIVYDDGLMIQYHKERAKKDLENLLQWAIDLNDYKLVKEIFETRNPSESTKKNALKNAIVIGNYNITRLILKNITTDINEDTISLLESTVIWQNNSILKLLIQKGIKLKGTHVLKFAVRHRNMSTLKILLENGADPKEFNSEAIKVAIAVNNIKAIRLLIMYGEDPKIDEKVYIWYKLCELLKKSENTSKKISEIEIWKICRQ